LHVFLGFAGTYADVFKAKEAHTGKKYAVKRLNVDDEERMSAGLREVDNMVRCRDTSSSHTDWRRG